MVPKTYASLLKLMCKVSKYFTKITALIAKVTLPVKEASI